jgi:2-polyprenyl-6-methoxyphenol hydroxylase-like FAD-dependent oxidoreductase
MALADARALAMAVGRHRHVRTALVAFDRDRRRPMAVYQRVSRLITPVFQSDHRALVRLRDRAVFPMSHLPIIERTILRWLSGIRSEPAVIPGEP